MEENRETENLEQEEVLEQEDVLEQEEPVGYVKRPWWQLALAWVCLALFLGFVAYQFFAIYLA